MKLAVKTLKGQRFDVEVDPGAKVAQVKQKIEELKGQDHFPATQQKLIHQGKVLKDDTTLAENNVTEAGFLVVMVVQPKAGQASAAAAAPPAAAATPAHAPPPAAAAPAAPAPAGAVPAAGAAQAPAATTTTATPAAGAAAEAGEGGGGAPAPAETYVEAQAASTLLAGSRLEASVQQILEMGGGSWDRETVLRALRAAYNNPERAIEYLYSGIPEYVEPAAPESAPRAPAAAPAPTAAAAAAASAAPAVPGGPGAAPAAPGIPNVAPLDLFAQGPGPGAGAEAGAGGGAGAGVAPGALDFLRTNPQFQALRAMVQLNPQLLQPMLQELGKQNPQLAQLIGANQAEFLRLLSEPTSSEDNEFLQQAVGEMGAAGAEGAQPHTLNVTPEEGEAISRLEAMGFDRQLVIEAYFACDKDEQLAANYLWEHGAEYND